MGLLTGRSHRRAPAVVNATTAVAARAIRHRALGDALTLVPRGVATISARSCRARSESGDRVAALSTTGPIQRVVHVVTSERDDQREAIFQVVVDQLAEASLRFGLTHPAEGIFVRRMDTGDNIRSASEGIKLVYGIIRWGVLALGGLGLLVSELIVVRQRSWFFGLSRATGARASHVATMVIADIALVLAAGTVLAIAASAAIQPVARSFAQSAFQVDVDLVTAAVLPQLVAGTLLVLAIACVYPTVVAVRQDPLDVLEPRQG